MRVRSLERLPTDFERLSKISLDTTLKLGLGRRQFTRHHGVGKSYAVVAAIAERLVGGMAAAAQRDDRPPGEAEKRSRGVADLEFTFDAKGAVVLRRDSDSHGLIVARRRQRPPALRYFFFVGGVLVSSTTSP